MKITYELNQRQRPLLSPLSYLSGWDFRDFITAWKGFTRQKTADLISINLETYGPLRVSARRYAESYAERR